MVVKNNINVEGIDFGWDIEKGALYFESDDVVLFWISNVMKVFFDTIEEISGEDASNIVFETTGFRQGLIVGEFFEKIKGLEIAEATKYITKIYAVAGWGKITVKDLNFDTKKVTIILKDTWEYKINVAQGKKQRTNFLPAHFAGLFTKLFGTNIWYKTIQQQLAGNEYSIIEYFPSDVTVSHNIHELARKKESEIISRLETLVAEKTFELKELVKKLSSPVIPVLDGIVVVPLIGKYDKERSEELLYKTLNEIPTYQADYLILDLTGIDKDIDEHTAIFIDRIVSASALIGTKTVLVGISAELSMKISRSKIDLSHFDCFQTLQHGIYYALAQQGREIV
ncbi:STAS domain-containing protein [Bacillus kwashiorkori]|uniref:STAS domain-containing protein n=1 Tax=Bacillus kwashiorkori TaxID=1522318 RepID=UPI000781259E|nr:STAS domain-containing protein [Bacillus kwashiorkori]